MHPRCAQAGRRSTSPRTSSLARRAPTRPIGLVVPAPGRSPAEGDGQVQGEGIRAAGRDVAHRPAVDAPHRAARDRERQRELRPSRRHPARVGRRSARDRDPEMDAILWKMLGFGARMSKKAVKGAALTLRTPRRPRAGRVDRRRTGHDDGCDGRARAVHGRAARRRRMVTLDGDPTGGRDRARRRASASEQSDRIPERSRANR